MIRSVSASIHIDYRGLAGQRGARAANDMLTPGRETPA
jgi:hypothetical protein